MLSLEEVEMSSLPERSEENKIYYKGNVTPIAAVKKVGKEQFKVETPAFGKKKSFTQFK